MPEEDVEALRGLYDRWNQGDHAFDLFDAEVEIRQTTNLLDTPATFHGHDGLAASARALFAAYGTVEWHPERWIEAGEWRVVVLRSVGVGRRSGIRVEHTIAHALRVADGRITALHAYNSADEAFEALGLRG